MSSLWHPVGPAGTRTYWRRRIVLLLVLAALVTAVVALTTRGGEPGPSAQAAFEPSSPATTAASATPTDEPGAGSATASESATASPSATGDCSSDDLTLTVSTDAVTYGPGAKPRFGLKVQNGSDAACTVEVGSALERFTVSTAGGDRVWSSEDCTLRGRSETVELGPGEGHASAAVWQGGRSAAGCPTDLPRAEAGDYTVTASLGELTAESKSFSVS